MNQLVFQNKDQIVTSSRNIARDFGKEHKNVIRDIRGLLKNEPAKDMFYETTYIHEKNNQEFVQYLMNRDGFTLLVMGFTGKKAMEFKMDYMKAFNQMEQQIKELNKPSYMIDDPIKRAEIWISEQKEKKEIETKNRVLEQRVSEYEPKITYLDEILKSTDSVAVSQVAEDYGMTGQEMNKLLNQIGIQYKMGGQWLLYSKHKGNGYTKSNTVAITHTNGRKSVRMHTKWTQKGRLFIYVSLKSEGILPLIEINLNNRKKLEGVH
ncbi:MULTISPECIES: phage regulatory protein/antirepressor Ant [unclassified Oceanobacillus]|uniref:phage antirepressor KilAC domain-containing protein n=1 Tax=unclassified Oceanobacillus TaxID=2630292 RepID=UPI001BE990A4|nr:MULTISPECIES: phage regulatory protein/antirepressor Ant [unclassified Oceanobacillus]MBT2600917.1 phage regulatory protein/antirepressor Ant [Oceanobacillus sp. ISL-74]MBT2653422.1 phage regulatory protein/antirepressor Ant [Oceanobacillus sp. ISL-73]